MARFVLVHGAFHGAWCWERLTPHLRAAGHRVDALDLPGHGRDSTPLAGLTLADNARAVERHVRAVGEPVILVGHSLGGMSITQAAEAVPESIAALVYVTALVPAHGQRMADLPRRGPGDPIDRGTIIDEEAGTFTFAPDAIREAFYGECSDADAAWAEERLGPESLTVVASRVDLGAGAGAAVPRVYVECLRDRTITAARQRAMCAPHRFERILALDADHSPFLSRPRELAGLLGTLSWAGGRGEVDS